MYIGAILFLLVFVAIHPESRGYVIGLFDTASVSVRNGGSFSFFLVVIAIVASLLCLLLVKFGPVRHDPRNVFSNYFDDEE